MRGETRDEGRDEREGEKCENGGSKEGKDGFGSSSVHSSLWLGVLTTS